MSEFEAYNNKTKQWEVFPLSKLNRVENDKRYCNIVVVEGMI